MEKTKIAVVGLGGIAQIMHLPALKKISNVDIAAVCDINFNKAKTIAKKHNIKHCYKDLDSMLADIPDIKAVIIAARTDVHEELAVKCLEAGKDILVEKPIARNCKETQKIVDTAKKHNKILMVGMNNRFRNDTMLQRSFVKGNELGELFYVKTGWLKMKSSNEKWFMEKEKSGGGVFIDNGIVMLDLGMWMLGFPEIKSVSAMNYYHNTKAVEDSNVTFVRFKNGASLTLEVSWSLLRNGEFYYCNVFGTKGSSSINPLRIHKKMNNALFDITPKSSTGTSSVIKNSYEYQLKHFVGTVRGAHKLISSGEEALKVMQIVEGIYKSAKLGKEVSL
jgi:predicted dehydrogenase